MSKCTYCGDEYGTNPGTWCPECQGWQNGRVEFDALVKNIRAMIERDLKYVSEMAGKPGTYTSFYENEIYHSKLSAELLQDLLDTALGLEPKNAETN